MKKAALIPATTLLLALAMGGAVRADDDHIEARRLLDSGEILPLEVILERARQAFPGRILDVELEREDGHIAYEVEILGADGVVTEVYINARTGKVLSVEEDD